MTVEEEQRLRVADGCSLEGVTTTTHPECGQAIGATVTTVLACVANPFLPDCSELGTGDRTRDARAEFAKARMAYCGDQANAWQINCNGYTESAMPRAAVCVANGAIVTNGGTDVAAGHSLFNPACANMAGVLAEQTRICLIPSSSFTTGCMDGTHGAEGDLNTARTTACLLAPTTADGGEAGRCTGLVASYCGDATGTNPFNAGCSDADYDDERTVACLADRTDSASPDRCPGLVVTYCEANPLDIADDCMVADYDDERTTACLADRTDSASTDRCPSLVATYCTANPFDADSDCSTGTTYDPQRTTACLLNPTTADNGSPGRCTDLVMNYCGDSSGTNPFNAGCVASEYDDERTVACLADRIDSASPDRCPGLVVTYCEANPLDLAPDCMVADYDDERETECSKTGMSTMGDCTATVTSLCTANPFEKTTETIGDLCTGTYLDHDTRLAFCRDTDKLTDTKDSDCTGTITTACGDNPFIQTTGTTEGNLCDGSYDMARETECSKTGRSDLGSCTVTVTSLCDANPFEQTTGDIDMPADLCPEAYLTHDTRLAFCRDTEKNPINKVNDCDGTIKTACSDNPFDELCVDTYLVDDAGRLAFCRADRKKNVINHVAATFSQPVGCDPIRIDTCGRNPNDPVCNDNNAGSVTHADWLRGFDAPLAKYAAITNPSQHQFLDLSDTNVASISGISGAIHLNLNNARYDDHPIGKDGSDGFAFWRNSSGTNFVGITKGTDLGKPFAEKPTRTEVRWRGQIRAIGKEFHGTVSADLIVDIVFYAGLTGGNVGYINAFHMPNKLSVGFGGYFINGTFNRAGFLRGTARLSGVSVPSALPFPETTGLLRGLIGEEGIVGAFLGSAPAVSDVHRGSNFVGGFVAHPDVKPARTEATHAVWVASSSTGTLYYTPPNRENRGSQFLKGAAGRNPLFPIGNNPLKHEFPQSVNWGYITADAKAAIDLRHRGQPQILNSSGLGSVYYRSGYTLWYTDGTNTDTTRYYYAGLSHDANVGLTIHPSRTGTAVWNGAFRARRNGLNNEAVQDREFATYQSLALTINFGERKVSGSVSNGDTQHGDSDFVRGDGDFDISGVWDAVGVLSGSVNQRFDYQTENISDGKLTGLIGESGAIGAFISNKTGPAGFAGGFFVKP